MRSFPVLLVMLGGLTTSVMPAAARSDHGSCGTSSVAPSGPINLESIPMRNTARAKAVKAAGEDECDGGGTVSGALTNGEDDEFGDGDD